MGSLADDPAYPFANGQLANADGNFTGLKTSATTTSRSCPPPCPERPGTTS